jgi:hypothetical protein
VRYEDLVKDPFSIVQTILKKARVDVCPFHGRSRVMAHMKQKRSDSKGQHIYHADAYGIDSDDIRARLDAYYTTHLLN